MRIWFISLFLVLASISQAHEISEYYGEEEEGAFLLFDLTENKRVIEYNPQLCETRLSPCSTFKIASAIIGLDLGILDDESTRYKWDGSPQSFAIWEQDHTLASAIHYSANWYFQRLAEKIGENEYREYLVKFNYGNKDISSGLTHFWQGESLLITPYEQLDFLAKLYRNQLPISPHTLEIVKKILIIENTPTWILSGKVAGHQGLAWFIGHVKMQEHEYLFVNCMRSSQSTGTRAKVIAQEILRDALTPHDTDH